MFIIFWERWLPIGVPFGSMLLKDGDTTYIWDQDINRYELHEAKVCSAPVGDES